MVFFFISIYNDLYFFYFCFVSNMRPYALGWWWWRRSNGLVASETEEVRFPGIPEPANASQMLGRWKHLNMDVGRGSRLGSVCVCFSVVYLSCFPGVFYFHTRRGRFFPIVVSCLLVEQVKNISGELFFIARYTLWIKRDEKRWDAFVELQCNVFILLFNFV